jgi:hypothetical protein
MKRASKCALKKPLAIEPGPITTAGRRARAGGLVGVTPKPTPWKWCSLHETSLHDVTACHHIEHLVEISREKRADEDIPTTQPSPPTVDDPIVVGQDKSNDEIRIGPITRAHTKLLQQQVNSLLAESDIYCNQNFILPKSLFICMIKFIGEEGVQGSEEMQHMEHDVVIKQERAREEREAGATSMEDIAT